MDKDEDARELLELEEHLVKTLLPQAAYEQYKSGKIAKQFLKPYADRILKTSSTYLSSSTDSNLALAGRDDALAYALYYLPINFIKVRELLSFLPSRFYETSLDVLDFGCGPGTGILAVQSLLNPECRITGVDHSQAVLDIAAKIQTSNPWAQREVAFKRSRKIPTGSFDLIIAANVLNELGLGEAMDFFENANSHLKSPGVIIMLEPGSFESTRNLQTIRDLALSKSTHLKPLFPCTRSDPMLAQSQSDWCHGVIRWDAPLIVRQFDEITGFNKHRVKYSSIILGKDIQMRKGCRVLQDAEKVRQGSQALVCGENFYGKLTLPRKNRNEENRYFEKMKQFELVDISGIQDDMTLSAESAVRLKD